MPTCPVFAPRPMPRSKAVRGRCVMKSPGCRGSWTRSPGWSRRPGSHAEGRLYEIPMDAQSILANPDRALEFMEQAVDGCHRVGRAHCRARLDDRDHWQPRRAFLAERHPIAVTTGNSLTVYATLRNLEHYCEASGSRSPMRRSWCRHPGQHRHERGRAIGTALSAAGGCSEAGFSARRSSGLSGWCAA